MNDLKKQNIMRTLETLDLIKWLNLSYQMETRKLDDIYDKYKQDDPEIIIFTHWITYINDRMKTVTPEKWKKWVNFFGYIIKKYKAEINEFKKYEEFKEKIEVISNDIESSRKVKQIYKQDWGLIVYTLWILGKFYNKSLLVFLDKVFENFRLIEKNEDLTILKYLGFILNLLSYSVIDKKGNLKNTENFDVKLNSYFEAFKDKGNDKFQLLFSHKKLDWKNWLNNKRYRSKRLMACLRDLVRSIFFITQFQKIEEQNNFQYPNLFSKEANNWFSLNINDLELPGDRWNTRFFLPAVIKVCSLNIKRYDNASKMTREVYETIKILALKNKIIKSEKAFEYYPIDMDFTYWFAEKYCDKNNCDNCPFGSKGFQCDPSLGICNFYEKEKFKCKGKENCPIFNKKGMGMCGLCF